MSKKVIHLLPYDGIGGVETAARSMGKLKRDGMDFEVHFIFSVVGRVRQKWATSNPLAMLVAARRVIACDADVLIVSLWRSAIVGILAKCLSPKLKLVVFIHNATDVHWLDFIFTRWAMRLADEVWADSLASLQERFPNLVRRRSRVISFVTRRFEVLPTRAVGPDFIFWGRINVQKGLDRALRIFAGVLKQNPAAKFWIIGPDGGVLRATQQLCKELGVVKDVVFLGAATLDEIVGHARNASFYLQTSQFEGMAMSVVEAMQLGLVPIVTPVGEIPSYCEHGINALIVESDQQVVEEVRALLSSNEKYQGMRLNGIEAWNDRPLYAESVLQACEALLAGNKKVM